jgi:hypothetical protein
MAPGGLSTKSLLASLLALLARLLQQHALLCPHVCAGRSCSLTLS